MTLLMPLLCLPLGLFGIVAGLVLGFLLDTILIVYVIGLACKRFVTGKIDILRFLIDTKTIAEAALMVIALPESAEIPRDLFLIREWIVTHVRPIPFVPIAQHALRIAMVLFRAKDAIDRATMTGIVHDSTPVSRRQDVLITTLRIGAATRGGTDIHNLREARSLAVGLNISEETFNSLVMSEYGLDLAACLVLGASRHATHFELLEKSKNPPESFSKEQVREAFGCLESQLDLIVRHLAIR